MFRHNAKAQRDTRPDHPRRHGRRLAPTLSRLEDRQMLSGQAASLPGAALPSMTIAGHVAETRVVASAVAGPAGFVTGLYTSILLRSPQPSEVDYWVGVLNRGVSPAFVQRAFLHSPERQQLLASLGVTPVGSNKPFVDSLYVNLLKRQPDPGGEAFWVQQLRRGENRQLVIQGFLSSSEYQSLQLAARSYMATSLVSDGTVAAAHTDNNLLNPWGLVASPAGPFWVSDNNAGVSTLYDGTGSAKPLVVTIPPAAGQTGNGSPTGIVFESPPFR